MWVLSRQSQRGAVKGHFSGSIISPISKQMQLSYLGSQIHYAEYKIMSDVFGVLIFREKAVS